MRVKAKAVTGTLLCKRSLLMYEGLRQPGKWSISHQKSAGVDSA